MRPSYFIDRILWVDCLGALGTGIAMLLFREWLSSLYGLSVALVIGHASIHLIYGIYSFSLAVRKRRPMTMILVLIFANAAWAGFCWVFAASLIGDITPLAVAHLVLEGAYVGCLAVIEWNRRDKLLSNL